MTIIERITYRQAYGLSFSKQSGVMLLRMTTTLLLLVVSTAHAEPVRVTAMNFIRAESDMTFDRYVKQDAFGKFLHIREPVPIDKQNVIRMNRDTLYSMGIFDLSSPVTIVKPEPGNRFQSMLVINQDHSVEIPVEHGSGSFELTKDLIGTRYVAVIFRTFMDPNDPQDVKNANALQDKIEVKQASSGKFEIPDWDEKSLTAVRTTINELAAQSIFDTKGYFGKKEELDPIKHLLATAYGWGGNPDYAAVYDNVVPAKNDGNIAHILEVKNVPVDGFWSITVYNAKGYMEQNKLNRHSINNVTAKKNADGSVTVHFGGNPDEPNYLPVTKGWNYIVRMYQPRKEIVDGKFEFPKPKALG